MTRVLQAVKRLGRRTVAIAVTAAICVLATAAFVRAPYATAAPESLTLWSSSTAPQVTSDSDGQAVELGVRFRSDVAGSVLGIRFYKGAGNTGQHTGSVWDETGKLLATAKFTGESASGWQDVRFSSPVQVAAGATYVASYHTNYGHYAGDQGYFNGKGVDSGPLHALPNVNGVYRYGSSGFPTDTWNFSNYYVDVVFAPSGVPTPTPTSTPTPTPSPTPTPTGGFTFDAAGHIYDPDGKRFIPVGVNANGPDWVWSGPTIGQSAMMDKWGFNTLRLNTCTPGGCVGAPDQTTNNDLDGIVTEFTARKDVIMIAQHQYGAAGGGGLTDQHITELESWWTATAAKYASNPYVWFNLINEPTTGDPVSDLPYWLSVSQRLASAVRSVAPKSTIVFDGNSNGQDKGGWGCDGTDWPNASAILNYGEQIKQTYGNVVFSAHLYGQWGGNEEWGCSTSTWTANMNAYLDAVQAKGLPLVAGEYGSAVNKADESWQMGGSWNATHVVYSVLPARGIGVLFWHGDAGAGSDDLLNPDGNWTEWGDPNHSGLTWEGQALHDYARQLMTVTGRADRCGAGLRLTSAVRSD